MLENDSNVINADQNTLGNKEQTAAPIVTLSDYIDSEIPTARELTMKIMSEAAERKKVIDDKIEETRKVLASYLEESRQEANILTHNNDLDIQIPLSVLQTVDAVELRNAIGKLVMMPGVVGGSLRTTLQQEWERRILGNLQYFPTYPAYASIHIHQAAQGGKIQVLLHGQFATNENGDVDQAVIPEILEAMNPHVQEMKIGRWGLRGQFASFCLELNSSMALLLLSRPEDKPDLSAFAPLMKLSPTL